MSMSEYVSDMSYLSPLDIGYRYDVGGKEPTMGDIASIIESGVNPADYKKFADALYSRGFNPWFVFTGPVLSDIQKNYEAGAYSGNGASSATGNKEEAESWLGEMPGMPTALRERETWLNERFGDYIGAQEAANAKYGGVLDSLTGRINDPNSRVSFGLEGADPVSFIPRQTLNEMSAIESLADLTRSNAMRVPTEQWAWNQSNPVHTADIQIFDLMNQLANQEESRRYGIPTQINTASYTQPKPDMLTLLTAAGNLANKGLDIYGKGQKLGFWGQ